MVTRFLAGLRSRETQSMSAKFVCDCCGKTSAGVYYASNPASWFKPMGWFTRTDERVMKDACSLVCLEKLEISGGCPLRDDGTS
jgi:hypothetical protein